jgi:hypothetical protein
MYNFSNNTAAADQHHHDHDQGTVGSNVEPKHDKNSNAKSTHGNKKRNHHKLEKESKDMRRTIKNSITPVVAAFAVSMIFLFGLVGDAPASDKGRDYDWNTRSYSDKAFARYDDKTVVGDGENKFAGITDAKFTDAEDNWSVKSGKGDFADSDANQKAKFDGDKTSYFDIDKAARAADQGFAIDDERNFADIKKNKPVAGDGDMPARVDVNQSRAKGDDKPVDDGQDNNAGYNAKGADSFVARDFVSFDLKNDAAFNKENGKVKADNNRPHRFGFAKADDFNQ